jgi:hypothetical protein
MSGWIMVSYPDGLCRVDQPRVMETGGGIEIDGSFFDVFDNDVDPVAW